MWISYFLVTLKVVRALALFEIRFLGKFFLNLTRILLNYLVDKLTCSSCPCFFFTTTLCTSFNCCICLKTDIVKVMLFWTLQSYWPCDSASTLRQLESCSVSAEITLLPKIVTVTQLIFLTNLEAGACNFTKNELFL